MKLQELKNKMVFCVTTIAIIMGIYSPALCAQDINSTSPRVTIIFVDKTTSAMSSDAVMAKYQSWITKAIRKGTIESGDRIYLSYIFNNTTSLTNKTEFVFRLPTQQSGRMSSSQERIAKVRYNKRVESVKRGFSTKIIDNAFEVEPSFSGTDVAGSLLVIKRLMENLPKSVVNVYYFSDMKECSDFRRFYCGKKSDKPASYSHAQTMAKSDNKRLIKDFELPADFLSSVNNITVVFPATELVSDEAYSLMPGYWETLFNSFGARSVVFH